MNYSTENWEAPMEFKPERFLEGSKNTHDKVEAMQPFSLGPRNCIGRKYVTACPLSLLAFRACRRNCILTA